ncbi:hypothetical protein Dsin_006769 [Dipteronia sinensis]|uniref:Senescence regulator n=1 Tax=Dipteronia sinensis TaxID=43782 RepID=A0AAE0AZB2_9ROSI|nr:hypothetical protein Dsin_006769 [Dipteronia sinensis]
MDSGFRHRRSPSSDRFLGISSSATSIASSSGCDELNEDDILWTNDPTEPNNNDRTFITNATAAVSIKNSNSINNNRSPSFTHPHNSGILAALPERENRPVVYRKPSASSSTTSKLIPSIPKPPLIERSQSMPPRKFQHSAPMNVPVLSIAMAKQRNSKFFELNEDDGGDEMLPPHEIVARGSGMSPKTTFSVLEGVGRTLKGRDLRQVRNAVFRQTGFLD